jgi:hypothetical protein
LIFDLLFRHFDLRQFDDSYFRHNGGDSQHDLRHNVSLSRAQNFRELLGFEAYRRNCEPKGPGKEIAKGKLSVVA